MKTDVFSSKDRKIEVCVVQCLMFGCCQTLWCLCQTNLVLTLKAFEMGCFPTVCLHVFHRTKPNVAKFLGTRNLIVYIFKWKPSSFKRGLSKRIGSSWPSLFEVWLQVALSFLRSLILFLEVTTECKIRVRSCREGSHNRKTVQGVVPPGDKSTHFSDNCGKRSQQTCYPEATGGVRGGTSLPVRHTAFTLVS